MRIHSDLCKYLYIHELCFNSILGGRCSLIFVFYVINLYLRCKNLSSKNKNKNFESSSEALRE